MRGVKQARQHFFANQTYTHANHAIRANRRNNFYLRAPFWAKFAKDYLKILENREWADTDQGGAVANPKSRNAIL